MNIAPSAINALSLVRSTQQSNKSISGSSSDIFNNVFTTAEIENEAEAISKQYSLSVGVETVPKNEKEIVRRGGSEALPDIVIAPNILRQMKTDSALKEKINGYINYYNNEDRRAFAQMEQMYGVNVVGRSLIIHEDGSYTIWSASETSPEEVEKGKKIEAEQQKEKEEKARQAARHGEESMAATPFNSVELLQAEPFSPLHSTSALSAQEWLQLNLFLKVNKKNPLDIGTTL